MFISVMDKTKKKVGKGTEDLNNNVHQPDLTGISKTLHPKTPEYTLFSSALNFFIGHGSDHKINLHSFKRTDIKQTIFSDYNGMKLKITERNFTYIWKLKKYILLINQLITEEIKEKLENTWRWMRMQATIYQNF